MFDSAIDRPAEEGIVDAPLGRPRTIRVGDQRIPVTAVEAMRDETAAYPPASGPRQVFLVRAQRRRYRLVHALREGRWTVEELTDGSTVGGLAA
jgi:hypothetical protein